MAGTAGVGGGSALFLLICQNGLLVVGRGFPLYKGDGPGGTGGQTVSKPIAVIIPHEFCFPVYHGDGALVAGSGTGAAAVAFFFINFYNPTNHKYFSFRCFLDVVSAV